MSDDQFAKLFKYMTERFDKLDAQKADKVDIDRFYALLDADLTQRETDEQERRFMARQLDRHHSWIGQLAKTTKTKLAPEQ